VQLSTLLQSGEVRPLLRTVSPATRVAFAHAYRTGFVEAFTTILTIAGGVALAGAVCAFVLVRSRDFVTTADEATAAEAPVREPVGAAAG